jgi:hypothetical protein
MRGSDITTGLTALCRLRELLLPLRSHRDLHHVACCIRYDRHLLVHCLRRSRALTNNSSRSFSRLASRVSFAISTAAAVLATATVCTPLRFLHEAIVFEIPV